MGYKSKDKGFFGLFGQSGVGDVGNSKDWPRQYADVTEDDQKRCSNPLGLLQDMIFEVLGRPYRLVTPAFLFSKGQGTDQEPNKCGDRQNVHCDQVMEVGEELTPKATMQLEKEHAQLFEGDDVLLSVILPLTVGGSWLWVVEGCVKGASLEEEDADTWIKDHWKRVHVPYGHVLIFRGDLPHAGCGYINDNYRFHAYAVLGNEDYVADTTCLLGNLEEAVKKWERSHVQ